jgi:hypothetical protein
VHGTHPRDRLIKRSGQALEYFGTAARPRHAEQQGLRVVVELEALELALDPDEVAVDQLPDDPVRCLLRVAASRAIGSVMSERSANTLPCSSNIRYAGRVASTSPCSKVRSYSSAGVYTSP